MHRLGAHRTRQLVTGCREYHGTRSLWVNPYYFYDLAAKQPKRSSEEVTNYGTHMSFDPLANISEETMPERVSRVFGGLGSRDASRLQAESKAINVCGMTVPPRPEEPTNCCMSGCVNCVWELYKDELVDWREKVQEATDRLMRPENLARPWPRLLGPQPEARKEAQTKAGIEIGQPEYAEPKGREDDNLGVGIEVFIQTEKRLKQKRRGEQGQKPPSPQVSSP